jgi:apolipoprotein N-acyltransferase
MTDAVPRFPARWARPALALFAGFLVALSLPPWGFWPLTFVGIVLFETALGPTPDRRQRFGYGSAFGFAWLSMGMGWMWFLTIPGYVVASAFFAALHGLAALAAPGGSWRVIARPAAHTLVEALRFSFPFGGVPLASIGIAQAGGPFVGVARVGGVIALTWVVFQIGFALAGPAPAIPGFARRLRPGARGVAHGVAGFAAAILVVVVAAFAPRGEPTGATLTIAVVQGGGEQGTRAIDTPAGLVTERHLAATRTIQPDRDLDMVLWPENVIDVTSFATSAERAAIAAEAARLGVPFVVGITEDVDAATYGEGRVSNAQVVVLPDGTVSSRYDKVRRVPFGEYVPLRNVLEFFGAPIDQVPTNAVPGTGPAYLELPDGTRFAVVISWEVFFGGRARDGVSRGGLVVLNPTNGSSYTGTLLQTQQIASSRLRATETGRWVVQAAPTGFSGFISPTGEVVERTRVSERKVIRQRVELRSGDTWYVRLGNAPFITAAALVLMASMWLARDLDLWASRARRAT